MPHLYTPEPAVAYQIIRHLLSLRARAACVDRRSEWALRRERNWVGTPPNIEARPSASGARSRSYTRGSEVGEFITITITITIQIT